MIFKTIKVPLIIQQLNLNENCWVAGGAALNLLLNKEILPYKSESDNDIDIFFKNEEVADNYIRWFKKHFDVYLDKRYTGESYYGIIYLGGLLRKKKYKINIIKFNFKNSPLETIKEFDVTPSQVALDINGNIIVDPCNYQDILNQTLEFVDFDKSFNERKTFYLGFNGYPHNNTSRFTTPPSKELMKNAEEYSWKTIKKRVEKYKKKGFEPGLSVAYKLLEYEGVY